LPGRAAEYLLRLPSAASSTAANAAAANAAAALQSATSAAAGSTRWHTLGAAAAAVEPSPFTTAIASAASAVAASVAGAPFTDRQRRCRGPDGGR
jgi:hypothetical protein